MVKPPGKPPQPPPLTYADIDVLLSADGSPKSPRHHGVPRDPVPSPRPPRGDLDAIIYSATGVPVGGEAATRLMAEEAGPRGPIAEFFAKFIPILPPIVVSADGKEFTLKGQFRNDEEVADFVSGVGNHSAGEGCVPRSMLFIEAQPLIFRSVDFYLLDGMVPIHGSEEVGLKRSIEPGEEFKATLTVGVKKIRGTTLAILSIEFVDEEGVVFATTKTLLSLARDLISLQPKIVDPSALGQLVLTREITGATIDDYAQRSGDYNVVHMDAKVANSLGLEEDRILHGMYVDNFAAQALFVRRNPNVDSGGKTKTTFGAVVYPGDTLSAYVDDARGVVTVINQRSELVLVRETKEGS